MARFTDQDKWRDSWFRTLKPAEKLIWLYLIDTCDNAGFFEYDPEMICFFTGMDEGKVSGAIEALKRGLSGPKGDGVYHINNFLKHQRNIPLNDGNNAHKQIIRIFESRRDIFESLVLKYLGPNEGLISPPGKGKGKGISNGRVKVVYSADFLEFWKLYGIGGKKPAFEAWEKQKISDDEKLLIINCIPNYKAHCVANDRTLKDAQGWINQRFWESEWPVNNKPSNGQIITKSICPDFV